MVNRKRVQNFRQKLFNSTVVEARQNFQFCRQNIWFLENNNFFHDFYIT